MVARHVGARFVRFGTFEADLQEKELYRSGHKLRLQNQPFEVLEALLERPGETVSSEELSRRIWPEGTYVDFEHGLYTDVLKIRRVLDDSAENPRFIETVPRHGYRFIAPVEFVAESRNVTPIWPALTPWLLWALPITAAVILATVVALLLWPETTTSENVLTIRPLTTSPGSEWTPSFSPDGNQVAYAWCEEGSWLLKGNCEIFVKLIGTESSLQLTSYPWVDVWPAWSPDGRFIAFLRNPPEGKASYLLIPAIGGHERLLIETFPPMPPPLFGTGISWFPDGDHLAIVVRDSLDGPRRIAVISVQTSELRMLTDPAPEGVGDIGTAVSPDGRSIAVVRAGPIRDAPSEIFLLELSEDLIVSGGPRQIASALVPPVTVAWMSDGDALVFSSQRCLWRVGVSDSRSRRPDQLTFSGEDALNPALARDRRRLAYSQGRARQDIWQLQLTGTGEPSGSPSELISSTRVDGWSQYSPDGRRIAFLSNRSGGRQLHVCNADGSNPVQLTSFEKGVEAGYPGWSPDSTSLLFSVNAEANTDIYEVDAQGGMPRRLTNEANADYYPRWSRDGKHIYFTSNRSGEAQVWRMPAVRGQAEQITRSGGVGPLASPDESWVYYSKPGSGDTGRIWRFRLSDGHEELILDEVFRGNFAMSGQTIYFIPQLDLDCNCYHLQSFDTVAGLRSHVIDVRNAGGGLTVSADGRSLLFTTVVYINYDLMLVENFR